MKKNVKRMSQAMSLGLCAALMATTALAATGTPYSGAAADIAAPAGQQATLLVDGKVTRFDGSDAVYTDADKAVVVYTDDLDDSSSRLSSLPPVALTKQTMTTPTIPHCTSTKTVL